MEMMIDRSSYRRENIKCENKPDEKKNGKINKLLLDQVIISMAIIIGILMLKVLRLDNAYTWVDKKINTGMTYDEFSSIVVDKIQSMKVIVDDWNKEEMKQADQNEKIEQIIKAEENEKKYDNYSGEVVYETAVEGINQLSNDAKTVKEKYSIIRPITGTITSIFGCRVDDNPIVSSYHTGLDIAANTGTTILAAHDGEVINAGENGTYGKCVMIKNGEILTVYAHCSKVTVKKGVMIKQGEKIGEVGMTGNATGPHLHFEIRYEGRFVNPEDVF